MTIGWVRRVCELGILRIVDRRSAVLQTFTDRPTILILLNITYSAAPRVFSHFGSQSRRLVNDATLNLDQAVILSWTCTVTAN